MSGAADERTATLDGLDPSSLEFNDPPVIVWVRVQDAVGLLWRDNPKLHDVPALRESLARHGYKEPARFAPLLHRVGQSDAEAPLGALEVGNGRIEALAGMELAGDIDVPRGLATDGGGAWAVWILTGTDAASRAMAESYAVDSNNLTMAGGGMESWTMARVWDREAYARLLEDLARHDALPVSVGGEDLGTLLNEFEVQSYDYTDFDQELEDLDGMEEVVIKITVVKKYCEQVIEWLANGERKTAPGMGKGVLKRCGLL